MPGVAVRLLHAEPAAAAGPLARSLAAVRLAIAERTAAGFRDAGARDVEVVAGPADDTPFGRRLRELVGPGPGGGIVVAGSGALALATPADLRDLLAVAAAGDRVALANNRYSADAVAIADAGRLAALPDLAADNALPRWLAEVAGYRVDDLRTRGRLQVDVDGPLDAVLAGAGWPEPAEVEAVRETLRRVAGAAADPRRELVVAGRTSARTLGWLERRAAARVRAIVEERGLRAAAPEARADGASNPRPPASLLGVALEAAGPEGFGSILSRLADAALVDTRVLLAHRLGPDERAWPPLEDRLASDLLLDERIADPWLAALTRSAREAPIPIMLGGHTLVGPGLPLALVRRR